MDLLPVQCQWCLSLWRQELKLHRARKAGKMEAMANLAAEAGSQGGEGWKLVTSGNRKNIPVPPADFNFRTGAVTCELLRTKRRIREWIRRSSAQIIFPP